MIFVTLGKWAKYVVLFCQFINPFFCNFTFFIKYYITYSNDFTWNYYYSKSSKYI